MMRSLLSFCAVVSTAVLFSEIIGLAVLWGRGNLTSDTARDVYQVLSQAPSEQKAQDQKEVGSAASMQDISLMRISRILELNARESELSRIEQFLWEKKNEISLQLTSFEKQQGEFHRELDELIEKINSDSTKRARNVLVSLPPEDAVENMMNMTLEENVTLIQGMPDKTIAKIMTEFNKGNQNQKKRGQDILQAMLDGKPSMELANQALEKTSPTPQDTKNEKQIPNASN